MTWPINETYTFTRSELEALLDETCTRSVEIALAENPDQALPLNPPAIEAAVQEALESLWRQVLPVDVRRRGGERRET